MGRLKKSAPKCLRRIVRAAYLWFVPILVALAIVSGVHQAVATTQPTVDEIISYLQENELSVGVDVVDGYRHVFYTLGDDKRVYLTNGSNNHSSPVSYGRHMVWTKTINGLDQLFLYDVLAKSLVQITQTGNNAKPVIGEGKVVWQRVENEEVRSYLLDFGISASIRQLGHTGGVEPAVSGDRVLYAQPNINNTWDIHLLDLSTDIDQVIASGRGLLLGGPVFQGERIVSGLGVEEFNMFQE